MNDPFYEVWADDGLPHPYLLLVMVEADGGTVVFDPKQDKVAYRAPSYNEARLWLLEDEYTRVEGRIPRNEA